MKFEKLLLASVAALIGYQGSKMAAKAIINKINDSTVKSLMTKIYDQNLWEFISATTRVGPQVVVETNLRAQAGKLIERPLGPPKKFPSLDSLMFSPAQMTPLPTPLEVPVDTSVKIGRLAKKPFTIALPMMVSAMAYGEALSAKAKWALAKGAAMAGTASCSGEGPYLPEEHQAAKIYIHMYNRGNWGKSEEILKNSEGIEVQFGQGAFGGTGHVFSASKMDSKLRRDFQYPKGKDAVTNSRLPEAKTIRDIPRLVDRLRDVSGGVPIGAKIAAGKWLEGDLGVLCDAGFDYIVIDGAEAATKGSAPILQDDFGIPTVYAVSRAADWLNRHGLQDRVSLIASGKIRTPGDVLKALALGADACYVGAIALFAMSHTQVLKSLPFDPPTQIVWFDGKYAHKFNAQKGAESLHRFFTSCKLELKEGIRAAGKTSLKQFSKKDLCSIDEQVAMGVGVPMAYESTIRQTLDQSRYV